MNSAKMAALITLFIGHACDAGELIAASITIASCICIAEDLRNEKE